MMTKSAPCHPSMKVLRSWSPVGTPLIFLPCAWRASPESDSGRGHARQTAGPSPRFRRHLPPRSHSTVPISMGDDCKEEGASHLHHCHSTKDACSKTKTTNAPRITYCLPITPTCVRRARRSQHTDITLERRVFLCKEVLPPCQHVCTRGPRLLHRVVWIGPTCTDLGITVKGEINHGEILHLLRIGHCTR